jgi:hypothetical protein
VEGPLRGEEALEAYGGRRYTRNYAEDTLLLEDERVA